MIGGIVLAISLLAGAFTFFISPGSDRLLDSIVMAALFAFGLSVACRRAVPSVWRNRDRITVTGDAVAFQRWSDGRETTLQRKDGDLLLTFPRFFDRERYTSVLLAQLGTGQVVALTGFPRGAVRRACRRRGWRFGYDPVRGERDLRLWLDRGARDWEWLRIAASLVDNYGPVDVAAKPGGRMSLGAAILSGYAAGLPPDYPGQGDAYGLGAVSIYCLAAAAQRSFAALAPTPEEKAARLAEAGELQALARSLSG